MFKNFSCSLCLFILLMAGCSEDKALREYQEFSKQPDPARQLCVKPHDYHDHSPGHEHHDAVPAASGVQLNKEKIKAHIHEVWSNRDPAWGEAPPAAMSLATFKPAAEGSEAQVTFTVLSGDGGGVEGNVGRWIGQLDHLKVTEAQIKSIIAELRTKTVSSGVSLTPVDFTSLGGKDTEPSMLAAVISLHERTLFIKLSGPLSELKRLSDEFFDKAGMTAELKEQDKHE